MHSDEPLSQANIDLIRAHSEELKGHVRADVEKYWDRINAHCPKRLPTEKSPPLPHQVETEATMENLKEKTTRPLIKPGRIEREIRRKRNQ